MEKKCPFCWGQKIRKVVEVALNGTGQTRNLLECMECEKWFWDDSGEEIFELAELCQTMMAEPTKCTDVIIHPIRAGYFRSPKTKIKEFNHICSECSYKRFSL
jgi:hypothetical protein